MTLPGGLENCGLGDLGPSATAEAQARRQRAVCEFLAARLPVVTTRLTIGLADPSRLASPPHGSRRRRGAAEARGRG